MVFQISRPCLPCRSVCDQVVCTPSCKADETQVIHFNLTDLALEPWQTAMNSSESLLQPYFVTVKAVTGSGRSVTVSSAGVYVDMTPPIIQMIYHIDFSWSKSEPTTFQGDNSSISIYYEVVDRESQVVYRVLHLVETIRPSHIRARIRSFVLKAGIK